MMDGLGLAESTPGPLILVTEFAGFITAFHTGGPRAVSPVRWWLCGPPLSLVFCGFAGAPYIEGLTINRACAARWRLLWRLSLALLPIYSYGLCCYPICRDSRRTIWACFYPYSGCHNRQPNDHRHCRHLWRPIFGRQVGLFTILAPLVHWG